MEPTTALAHRPQPTNARPARALLLAVLGSLALAAGASGQELSFSPAQVSLTPTVAQLPTEDTAIKGLSLNLYYGVQKSVTGLDVGVLNGIDEDLHGVGIGLLNEAAHDVRGLQLSSGNMGKDSVAGAQVAAFANRTEGTLRGVQIGLGNGAREANGLQAGFFDWTETARGAQLGLIGVAESEMTGVQLDGFVSLAKRCRGVQLGPIFTSADSGSCLQLGFLNFNGEGFLPVFPLFNLSL